MSVSQTQDAVHATSTSADILSNNNSSSFNTTRPIGKRFGHSLLVVRTPAHNPAARRDHQDADLAFQLLLIGGCDEGFGEDMGRRITTDCFLFDVGTNEWQLCTTSNLSNRYLSSPVCASNSNSMVFLCGGLGPGNSGGGGSDDFEMDKNMYLLNTDNMSFRKLNSVPCPTPFINGTVTFVPPRNGTDEPPRIFLFGGSATSSSNNVTSFAEDMMVEESYNSLRILNIDTGQWIVPAFSESGNGAAMFAKPARREGHTAVYYPGDEDGVGRKIIIFGGRVCGMDGYVTNEMYFLNFIDPDEVSGRFDDPQNVFSWGKVNLEGKLVPPPRQNHSAVLWRDKMIVHAGKSDAASQPLDGDIWSYDCKEAVWQKLRIFGDLSPLRRFHSASAVFFNQLYIYGGYDNEKVLDDLWVLSLGVPPPPHKLQIVSVRPRHIVVSWIDPFRNQLHRKLRVQIRQAITMVAGDSGRNGAKTEGGSVDWASADFIECEPFGGFAVINTCSGKPLIPGGIYELRLVAWNNFGISVSRDLSSFIDSGTDWASSYDDAILAVDFQSDEEAIVVVQTLQDPAGGTSLIPQNLTVEWNDHDSHCKKGFVMWNNMKERDEVTVLEAAGLLRYELHCAAFVCLFVEATDFISPDCGIEQQIDPSSSLQKLSPHSCDDDYFTIWEGCEPYYEVMYDSLLTRPEVLKAYETCIRTSMTAQEVYETIKNRFKTAGLGADCPSDALIVDFGLDIQGKITPSWPVKDIVVAMRFRVCAVTNDGERFNGSFSDWSYQTHSKPAKVGKVSDTVPHVEEPFVSVILKKPPMSISVQQSLSAIPIHPFPKDESSKAFSSLISQKQQVEHLQPRWFRIPVQYSSPISSASTSSDFADIDVTSPLHSNRRPDEETTDAVSSTLTFPWIKSSHLSQSSQSSEKLPASDSGQSAVSHISLAAITEDDVAHGCTLFTRRSHSPPKRLTDAISSIRVSAKNQENGNGLVEMDVDAQDAQMVAANSRVMEETAPSIIDQDLSIPHFPQPQAQQKSVENQHNKTVKIDSPFGTECILSDSIGIASSESALDLAPNAIHVEAASKTQWTTDSVSLEAESGLIEIPPNPITTISSKKVTARGGKRKKMFEEEAEDNVEDGLQSAVNFPPKKMRNEGTEADINDGVRAGVGETSVNDTSTNVKLLMTRPGNVNAVALSNPSANGQTIADNDSQPWYMKLKYGDEVQHLWGGDKEWYAARVICYVIYGKDKDRQVYLSLHYPGFSRAWDVNLNVSDVAMMESTLRPQPKDPNSVDYVPIHYDAREKAMLEVWDFTNSKCYKSTDMSDEQVKAASKCEIIEIPTKVPKKRK